MTCHPGQFASWVNTGHPYKIVPKAKASMGMGYPAYVQAAQGEANAVDADFFTDQAGLVSVANAIPNGWDDVSYVIGGYGWKTRFIGTDGYIITGGKNGSMDSADWDKVQFNFPFDPGLIGAAAYPPLAATAGTYHTEERKPYTCGGCHTTGWIPDGDAATDGDLTDNQDGLEGIHGTWVEPGVACEACHGPSRPHTELPYLVRTADDAEASCANCHIRGDPYEVDTSGGFIRHHEQFEELITGKHQSVGCPACHDPHEPVRYQTEYMALDGMANDPNPGNANKPGIRRDCVDCHFDKVETYATWAANYPGMALVTCEQCHMPRVTKSAVKAGKFSGDTRTHIFAVNTRVDPIANMGAGSTAASSPAKPYLTLDWTCGGCHSDTAEGTDMVNTDFYQWANATLTDGNLH